jgi:hypothetical protein
MLNVVYRLRVIEDCDRVIRERYVLSRKYVDHI